MFGSTQARPYITKVLLGFEKGFKKDCVTLQRQNVIIIKI